MKIESYVLKKCIFKDLYEIEAYYDVQKSFQCSEPIFNDLRESFTTDLTEYESFRNDSIPSERIVRRRFD